MPPLFFRRGHAPARGTGVPPVGDMGRMPVPQNSEVQLHGQGHCAVQLRNEGRRSFQDMDEMDEMDEVDAMDEMDEMDALHGLYGRP